MGEGYGEELVRGGFPGLLLDGQEGASSVIFYGTSLTTRNVFIISCRKQGRDVFIGCDERANVSEPSQLVGIPCSARREQG